MVEPQPSKLVMRVRFPSPAPTQKASSATVPPSGAACDQDTRLPSRPLRARSPPGCALPPGGVVSSATPGGSGPQVGGGPARAVHVERRGVMLVGDLPARGRPAEPDGGPEPQVDLLPIRLRACHMGEAMAEGDVVTRLDDRVADVVADRAFPGRGPTLDRRRAATLLH